MPKRRVIAALYLLGPLATALCLACDVNALGSSATATPETTATITSVVDDEPIPTPNANARFDTAGLVEDIDTTRPPREDDFVTSFRTGATEIDAVFRLSTDTHALVVATWRRNGIEIPVNGTTRIEAGAGEWAYFGLTAPASGFSSGSYDVVLTIPSTNQQLSLPFSIR